MALKGFLLVWLLSLVRADVLFSGVRCFFEDIEAGRLVKGELRVYGPHGGSRTNGTVEVAAWEQGGAGTLRQQLAVVPAKIAAFSFEARSTVTHRICVAPSAHMEVSLRLRLREDNAASLQSMQAEKSPLSWPQSEAVLLARVQALEAQVKLVQGEQMWQRQRTRRFSGAGESAHMLTMWLAGGELVALIVAGLWQVQALSAARAHREALALARTQKLESKVV